MKNETQTGLFIPNIRHRPRDFVEYDGREMQIIGIELCWYCYENQEENPDEIDVVYILWDQEQSYSVVWDDEFQEFCRSE